MAELTPANPGPEDLKDLLREDLGAFTCKVFQTLNPGTPYLHNWHIDAIQHALTGVHEGRTKRLAITQPPRSLKSICTSVAWPAWLIGKDPSARFICVSYAQELADELARQFRQVIQSDWYRELFPKMRVARDTASDFRTTVGGGRDAVSVGGTLTGIGADIIVIDDPMKAGDAQSETARRRVNDWYGSTLLSRLNNKTEGAIVLVMQRLHEDDLAGHVLRADQEADGTTWQHLDLPAIATEDADIPIGAGLVHRRREGEVLHPDREPLEKLDELKAGMGSLAFSAQYQQRPMPLEGNLVRRDWFRRYTHAPMRSETGVQVAQSWDCASSTGEARDWSVCTTWAKRKRDYYLIDVWRGRVEFPELRRKAMELAQRHQPQVILIEDASAGTALLQEMRRNPVQGVPRPIGQTPKMDKQTRFAMQASRFEAGQVYLPEDAPWLAELEKELLGFPNARHDDQVDSVSQYLNWAENRHQWGGNPPSPNAVQVFDLGDFGDATEVDYDEDQWQHPFYGGPGSTSGLE